MEGFDKLIHQPNRLRIMAALHALDAGDSVDFSYLKKELRMTDGNLGAQILALEEAGYLTVRKTFVGRRPKTFLKASAKGRVAFEEHRDALRRLLDPETKE